MQNAVVIYPAPGMSHLVPSVELGKLIIDHQPSLSVTILITSFPIDTASIKSYVTRISGETPSLNFHNLPDVIPDSSDFVEMSFGIPRQNTPDVRNVLESIEEKSRIRAYIIDFFCNAASEASSGLDIPTYYLIPSNASGVSSMLYLSTVDKTTEKSLRDLNEYIQAPGIPPVFSSHMAEPILDRDSLAYKNFLSTAINMPKSDGIIVNSFNALEPRAVKALADEETTPPVYCIGPLNSTVDKTDEEHECIKWLNTQPYKSVVFLCFGSLGLRIFGKEQLYDMAIGLEKTGHRFLWVVRCSYDLNEVLPEGFLERTKDRGLVLSTWVPQTGVLSHDSVGAFVTHCGWKSILEAVSGGVPMVAWPLYAEQKMNKVFLVEEFGLGLGLTESETGFVSAAELEKRVRELMESESGKKIRHNASAMKDEAKAATSTGGSSRVAMENLITIWNK